MKKLWLLLFIPLLILIGLFFWKGGHHALVLANTMEDWLDADNANQKMTILIQQPGQDGNSSSITANTFWTEYEDERVFGLSAEGICVYLRGNELYWDTGRAYTLPEMPELKASIKRLSLGLLLYGRVTKDGDTYYISMKTKELTLYASVTADRTIQAVTIRADLSDGTAAGLCMTTEAAKSHSIPQPAADAMERSEKPMPLSEPLEYLLPAAQGLLPLSGDLELGVSCGILELSETVHISLAENNAILTRNGTHLELELPAELSKLPPSAMAVLLLRDGELTRTDDGAQFTLILPGSTVTQLLGTLVPEATDLGITLDDSILSFQITAERLVFAKLTAHGTVPFLFTTIPVDFSAGLTIS